MTLPLCLAAVGEGDDDVKAAAEQPCELVFRLREPASRERGPLRVERELLALRKRIELGRVVERQLGEALLGPDLAHLVGPPDEIGRAVERQHEVVGPTWTGGCAVSSSGSIVGEELSAPLRRRRRRSPPPARAARAG